MPDGIGCFRAAAHKFAQRKAHTKLLSHSPVLSVLRSGGCSRQGRAPASSGWWRGRPDAPPPCAALQTLSLHTHAPGNAVAHTPRKLQGVSFFDESLGAFYGATCRSPPETPLPAAPRHSVAGAAGAGAAAGEGGAGAVTPGSPAGDQQQRGQPALDVEFGFDVFYHSQISDPHCIAVVSDLV
jgi:hypothetical protein